MFQVLRTLISSKVRAKQRISPNSKLRIENLELLQDDCQDVALAQDEKLLIELLDLGSGVLGVEDAVPFLHVHRCAVAVIEELAGADGHYHRLLGLLLRRIGEIDTALGLLLASHRPHDHAVAERADIALGACFSHSCSFLLYSFSLPRLPSKISRLGLRLLIIHKVPRLDKGVWAQILALFPNSAKLGAESGSGKQRLFEPRARSRCD